MLVGMVERDDARVCRNIQVENCDIDVMPYAVG